jgi:mono/diheme cytochrome c family protein
MVVCKRDNPSEPCQSRGFAPLPTYADPRLRQMPDGQIFATITHGVRTMPAYGPQVPAADRWAIVAYVRALQLTQLAQATPQPQVTSQPEPKK